VALSRELNRGYTANGAEDTVDVLLKRIVRDGELQEPAGWSVATEFGVLLPTVNGDDDYEGRIGLTWVFGPARK